ncbi:hypothetical protein [Legionella parisiensis]|uniref:2,5-diketo-D-gluconic acid reductase A n=1 Tax=Legionella parisiensis TaxID=45071 RepID=A0A1E5JVU5_9GAMM|nr:hypothetical protein [Legionella parisiensis]KTD41289.1 2,5-diketo-D-gluconic acid reductase A [Legionella parisiensis]OEH48666.1 2,5-diketo-D-gluconic acid reductase A [Legionella parisiensis]STX76410.1 2,5-diketo-D-gluconic acid reductase A [Legionella parisiensis]
MNSSYPADPINIDSKNGMFQSGTISCPMVGFGSDKLLGQECTNVILQVAELGYRIIDTATAYNNLDAIGKALKNWTVTNSISFQKYGMTCSSQTMYGKILS